MAQESYDVIVIGSGPGGYTAAARAAEHGLKAVCIEKSPRLGGVCLNVGCIPSKALLDSSEHFEYTRTKLAEHGVNVNDVTFDLTRMMSRKDAIVENLTGQVRRLLNNRKVEIVHGAARLIAADRVEVLMENVSRILSAKYILLAAGSEPVNVPGLVFDGKYIVTSTEALAFDRVPKHLVIVGGGYIGLELGTVWRRLGAKVTVIEMLPEIASTLDRQIGRTLQRLLEKQGMSFHLGTRASQAQVIGETVWVTLETEDKSATIECDKLLVAVGRKPLTTGLGLEDVGVKTDARSGQIVVDAAYCTTIPNIYAIGDLIAGPMLAHKASAEARAAVDGFAGLYSEVNYDALPAVVYTWPEAASVGLTEEQLKAREIPYKTGNFPFNGVGRALCLGEKEGFVKMLAHAKTDRLLGVHIIGPRASELIAECTLAMEFGASAEDLARTIHAHPTLAEGIQEAAWSIIK
ncbi:dihydrolipoyl dehydrogenase [Candidatus Vecturithrix granuli]|uniref:Dihydrolipoyl dehydrogenase n=1 Tax=Vecturithrix granuli TaxID=1499967 RepID=A0A081C3K0_VECG1|nr:dihydrolipoyl dehydrogenase [Candidatus Vecturithrix granuli]